MAKKKSASTDSQASRSRNHKGTVSGDSKTPPKLLRNDLTPLWPKLDTVTTFEEAYGRTRLMIDVALIDAGWGLYGLFLPLDQFDYPGGAEAIKRDSALYRSASGKLRDEFETQGPPHFRNAQEFGAEIRTVIRKLKAISLWHSNILPVFDGYSRTQLNFTSILHTIEIVAAGFSMKLPLWPDNISVDPLIRWCDELLRLNAKVLKVKESDVTPLGKGTMTLAYVAQLGGEALRRRQEPKWAQWQMWVDEYMSLNPEGKYSAACREAKKKHKQATGEDVSERTVQNRTTNPRTRAQG